MPQFLDTLKAYIEAVEEVASAIIDIDEPKAEILIDDQDFLETANKAIIAAD